MILEVLTSKVEILSLLTQLSSSSTLLLRRSLHTLHLSKGRTHQTLGPWFQQDTRNKLRNFPFINRDERIGLTKQSFMHHSESFIVHFVAKEDLASIIPRILSQPQKHQNLVANQPTQPLSTTTISDVPFPCSHHLWLLSFFKTYCTICPL